MAIQRSGPTPSFVEYITREALIPQHQQNVQPFLHLVEAWLNIPYFQRGVSWEIEDIEKFYNSQSVLLGNVIMGQFYRANNQFQFLPETVRNYHYLVDGLQRFSVGTTILNCIYELVLGENSPYKQHSNLFEKLKDTSTTYSKIFKHNHLELINHIRKAISEPYKVLYADFTKHLKNEFDNGRATLISETLTKLFLERQIAIDIYFNFDTPLAITNTFLGINTVRVDLNTIDLIRANIIQKGTSAGWDSDEINDIEDSFTNVFTDTGVPNSDLFSFASVVWEVIQNNPEKIFPTWVTGLQVEEVETFLSFVERFKTTDFNNSYLNEIKNCGSATYSIIISIYYYEYLFNKKEPSFFQQGKNENEVLHKFLIACYRGILERGLGRTRDYADKIFLNGNGIPNLTSIAEQMALSFSRKNITEPLPEISLKTSLDNIDKKKTKFIFNAMLLPDKSEGFGGDFAPLEFGRKAINFNIDHLIPVKMSKSDIKGFQLIDTLRNVAPLPANLNREAKATNCSIKLSAKGMYDNYLTNPNPTHIFHPYSDWLVNIHAKTYTGDVLDNQALLEPTATTSTGSDRIDYITKYLLNRI